MWNEFAKNMSTKIQEEKRKDIDTANQNVGLVDQHLQLLSKHEAALKAAKESMDPTNIRAAAQALDSVRLRLMLTRDWLHRGIAQAPENVAELEAAEVRANEPLERIAAEVSHAREQADRLAAVQGGPLAALPQAPLPASPEETRHLAAEVAPLGLCDDPAMQSPSSFACPLSGEQRQATRDYVANAISAIAENWRDAAISEEIKLRIQPLFEKSGVNPLVDLLLSIATGWLSAQVGNLFLKSVNGARNALAQRPDPELTAMTGLPGPFGGAPELGKSSGALASGIGLNLATKTLGVFRNQAPTDTPNVLFDDIKMAATVWGQQAKLETRQLPDPVLAGLASGLSSSHFTVAYFRSRIERLVENFHHVDQIGQVSLKHTQPLQPIWVVSPTGGLRLALARRDTVMAPVGPHSGPSHEPEDSERERPTGQWIFDSWVDRTLYSVALARDASPPTIAAFDRRWKAAPSQAFDPGDIRMIGPETKETPSR